jgi:hypothetical protein
MGVTSPMEIENVKSKPLEINLRDRVGRIQL